MKLLSSILLTTTLLVSCDEPSKLSQSNASSKDVVKELPLDEVNSDVDAFVSAFMGYCVLNMPNLDKVEAFSRINEWEPLTKDMIIAFGPPQANSNMKGWSEITNYGPVFIATTDGVVDGDRHRNCSIMSKVSNVDELTAKLAKLLQTTDVPRATEVEAGQRYRFWSYSKLGDDFGLIVLDAQDMAPGVITVSSNYTSN